VPPSRPMGGGGARETAASTNRRAGRGRVLSGLGTAGSAECAVGERGWRCRCEGGRSCCAGTRAGRGGEEVPGRVALLLPQGE